MRQTPREQFTRGFDSRFKEGSVQELFIYYRSPEHHATRVQQLVGELQARLRACHPCLDARLLRRPRVQSEQITWMEAYSMNDPLQYPAGIDDALKRQIEAAASVLRECIDGERHSEVFIACAC